MKIDREEAINEFKRYADNSIKRIMHTRALLLRAEGKDNEKLKEEIDEFIATTGRKYLAKFDKMDDTALRIEALEEMARLMGGKVEEIIKEYKDE